MLTNLLIENCANDIFRDLIFRKAKNFRGRIFFVLLATFKVTDDRAISRRVSNWVAFHN